jgi:hypothetical protein
VIRERPALERRVLSALGAEPARIPVIVGGCGSGRTSLLTRIAVRLGDRRGRYIDVERISSTPERMLAAATGSSSTADDDPARSLPAGRSAPRAAFEALLAFVEGRDDPLRVLLLDEWLELRTLESFPGLRGAVRELVRTLPRSPGRFVLASRFANRTRRLLDGASSRFELVRLPPLSPSEVAESLATAGPPGFDNAGRTELGRLVHALTAGRPSYVEALAAGLLASRGGGRADPVAVLAAQMAAGAALSQLCRFSYELRLHRARGYGALKAILGILSDTEPLTLTEVARRLGRTPGSTKDYLSWLEDVDLIEPTEKRYRFADPLLRLWVRLHGRPTRPGDRERAVAAREYAAARLAAADPPPAPTAPPVEIPPPRRPQSLIEID